MNKEFHEMLPTGVVCAMGVVVESDFHETHTHRHKVSFCGMACHGGTNVCKQVKSVVGFKTMPHLGKIHIA